MYPVSLFASIFPYSTDGLCFLGPSRSPTCWFHAPQHNHQCWCLLCYDVFVRLFRTAAEANSYVALFWSMTLHAHIPPGRHRPCCMMHSIGTHLTILPTARTWHHRTFTSFRRWRSTLLVNDLQMMRTYSMLSWTGWIARRPSGKRREFEGLTLFQDVNQERVDTVLVTVAH